MKKTFFLSSWGAKLAFAAVMLTSPLLTSCEQEDLDATFQASPAKVTLAVDVFDALTGSNVTNQAAITVSNSSFIANGTTEFANGVTAQTITVTANVGEGIASSEVLINATKVGGVADYYVKLVVADGLEVIQTKGTTTEETKYATFTDLSHDANHSHEGITGWYVNATDYFQPFEVTYVAVNGYDNFSAIKEEAIYANLDDVHTTGIKAIYTELKNSTKKENKTYTGKASAWSYFNVYVTVSTSADTWTVQTINSNEVAASWTADNKGCTEAEYIEIAHPNHAGHYIHGHGHGNGNNGNAGGGIVIAE